MLTKTIEYTDYNGIKRKENFLFNLTTAEIAEMELGVEGGYIEMVQKIIDANDSVTLQGIFKELVLKAYGEKSADGKYFMKKDAQGYPLSAKFEQCAAYSVLYMELAFNDVAAAEFMKGIMPAELADQVDINEIMQNAKQE
jgi:hypothetical protein